jgi:hypothetical protein
VFEVVMVPIPILQVHILLLTHKHIPVVEVVEVVIRAVVIITQEEKEDQVL